MRSENTSVCKIFNKDLTAGEGGPQHLRPDSPVMNFVLRALSADPNQRPSSSAVYDMLSDDVEGEVRGRKGIFQARGDDQHQATTEIHYARSKVFEIPSRNVPAHPSKTTSRVHVKWIETLGFGLTSVESVSPKELLAVYEGEVRGCSICLQGTGMQICAGCPHNISLSLFFGCFFHWKFTH